MRIEQYKFVYMLINLNIMKNKVNYIVTMCQVEYVYFVGNSFIGILLVLNLLQTTPLTPSCRGQEASGV